MRRVLVLIVVLVACTPSAAAPAASASDAAAPASTPVARTTAAPTASGRALATSAPSSAQPTQVPLDPKTAALLSSIDNSCEPSNGAARPPSLGLLGAIADGRSARETVDVLAQSRCRLQPQAYGDGPSELVVVGAYRTTGALLWVDGGYWRIAPVPMDFGYLTLDRDRMVAGSRELLFTNWSGGSAGARGFLAVAIVGANATVTLHTPGASQMGVTPIGDDLLLMTGRHNADRPWGMSSNCCIPSGYEWLWRWSPSGYVLVAERQARGPYYGLNALLGALGAGKPALASDVASPKVLAAAESFFPSADAWWFRQSAEGYAQEAAEAQRWNALPTPATLVATPIVYEVSRYASPPSAPVGPHALITFERIGDGWIATDFRAGSL